MEGNWSCRPDTIVYGRLVVAVSAVSAVPYTSIDTGLHMQIIVQVPAASINQPQDDLAVDEYTALLGTR